MWILPVFILVLTVLLSIPTGRYLAWIMDGRYRPPRLFQWLESRIDTGPQDWKQYSLALVLFNALTFVVAFAALALQPWLPFNPDEKPMLGPTTIFHTTISFIGNNSQQHYAGEQHLSYFSQLVAIVWSMFVGGGVGLCVPGGGHSRLARRRPHGQFLPRRVARRRLRLAAGEPPRGLAAPRLRACR